MGESARTVTKAEHYLTKRFTKEILKWQHIEVNTDLDRETRRSLRKAFPTSRADATALQTGDFFPLLFFFFFHSRFTTASALSRGCK